MYSSRFHWDLQRNRLTELLSARRGQGARILDLTQSNPTRAGIEYPEELARVFDDARVLRYDPLPAGSLEAREAIAGYYRQRGHAVEPGRILLTASTSEAYSYLFKLLADPGDQVLVARPSYPLFEYLARMESLEVRQYPLEYHGGWAIDTGALARAITARTRDACIQCNRDVRTTEEESLKDNKFGSIAVSVGKRAMEKDASWKSPKARLSHCA